MIQALALELAWTFLIVVLSLGAIAYGMRRGLR